MKVTRRAPGRYDIHTDMGTFDLANCPADNPRATGFPSGPRWMLTWPGQYTADAEFRTKREALQQVRDCVEWQRGADMAQARQDAEPSLDDYATASRVIQSLIPGVRR